MKLHCDGCDRVLGDNIMDIREAGHRVGGYSPGQISIPDMICRDCMIGKEPPKNFEPIAYTKSTNSTNNSLHHRVRVLRGKPSLCEDCGTTTAKKFEWANLTGRYDDINDYKRLCTSCHSKFDKKILNIKHMSRIN